MSEISSSAGFEDQVDLSSWARFTPSLTTFLDREIRSGSTLLLTAPAPVVRAESLNRERPLTRLLSRLRRRPSLEPSPEVPGIVVVGHGDDLSGGLEMALPLLDSRDRALLGPEQCYQLVALGWTPAPGTLTRLAASGEEAAQAVTRILIEVLDVAHPADLDYLVSRD